MQGDGSRLATGGQKLPDLFHMFARLVLLRKLLQRDQRGCQCFRDNPFVVARDSLSWHEPVSLSLPVLRTHLHRLGQCRSVAGGSDQVSVATALQCQKPQMLSVGSPRMKLTAVATVRPPAPFIVSRP